MLDFSKIESVMNNKEEPSLKITSLVKMANDAGGTDNISVAYLEKEEEGGRIDN